MSVKIAVGNLEDLNIDFENVAAIPVDSLGELASVFNQLLGYDTRKKKKKKLNIKKHMYTGINKGRLAEVDFALLYNFYNTCIKHKTNPRSLVFWALMINRQYKDPKGFLPYMSVVARLVKICADTYFMPHDELVDLYQAAPQYVKSTFTVRAVCEAMPQFPWTYFTGPMVDILSTTEVNPMLLKPTEIVPGGILQFPIGKIHDPSGDPVEFVAYAFHGYQLPLELRGQDNKTMVYDDYKDRKDEWFLSWSAAMNNQTMYQGTLGISKRLEKQDHYAVDIPHIDSGDPEADAKFTEWLVNLVVNCLLMKQVLKYHSVDDSMSHKYNCVARARAGGPKLTARETDRLTSPATKLVNTHIVGVGLDDELKVIHEKNKDAIAKAMAEGKRKSNRRSPRPHWRDEHERTVRYGPGRTKTRKLEVPIQMVMPSGIDIFEVLERKPN